MKLGLKIATAISITLPVATGLWVWFGLPTNPAKSCVMLTVDFGESGLARPFEFCIPADGPIDAYTLLSTHGVDIQGTLSGGLSEICRINKVPDLYAPLYKVKGHEKYVERCHGPMPSWAHWVTLVKTAKHDNVPASGWVEVNVPLYGIGLQPGDSIYLAYATNGHYNHP